MGCAGFFSFSHARAAEVALEGVGYYDLGIYTSYDRYGTSQSKRYRNLGAGYHSTGEIGHGRGV